MDVGFVISTPNNSIDEVWVNFFPLLDLWSGESTKNVTRVRLEVRVAKWPAPIAWCVHVSRPRFHGLIGDNFSAFLDLPMPFSKNAAAMRLGGCRGGGLP